MAKDLEIIFHFRCVRSHDLAPPAIAKEGVGNLKASDFLL
jgi:hypothetical protein